MTLRKGFLIAVAVTVVITIVLPFFLLQYKPLRHIYLGLTMDVEDIRFYGRVIDQHGQPVVGAEVPFTIGGSALGGYRGGSMRITDSNGEFTIDTEGSSLSFDRIKHPDIEFGYPTLGKPGTWGYSHSSRLGVYGFQPQAGDKQALWTETSPEKPYIFKAWRIGKGEGEVARNLITGEHSNRFDYGKIITLDLTKPLMEQAQEGELPGQLRLLFHREIDAEDNTKLWNARIYAIDGGIQSTTDTYMNVAPETGYEPEIRISRDITSPNQSIDDLPNQQYYFKANNGQAFGSLFVSYTANGRSGQMKVRIRYKLNPDGQRILVKAPPTN